MVMMMMMMMMIMIKLSTNISIQFRWRPYEEVLQDADDQDQARLALAEIQMAKDKVSFSSHIGI
jgi:hypothetical protein